MDEAIRLTRPTADHPATGAPKTDKACPTIVWREYWDVKTRRPYYHNLVTQQVTFDMPERFPSRFLEYYARLNDEAKLSGLASDDHIRAQRVAQVGATPLPSRSYRDKLLDYGPSGMGLYLIIHFIGFLASFTALSYGMDVSSIAATFGIDMPPPTAKTSFGATFLGAVAINKLMVPFQIGLTLMLAPKLTPYLKLGWKRFVYFNQ